MIELKQNYKEVFGFNDTMIKLIGIPLISLLLPILFNSLDIIQCSYGEGVVIAFCYTAIIWFGARFILALVLKNFPIPGDILKSVTLQVSLILIYLFVINITGELIQHKLGVIPLDKNHFIGGLGISLIICVAVLAIYEGIYLYKKLIESHLETERLKRVNAETQFDALKRQVNPHFLFNSLNTLSSLIPNDTEKAQEFIEQLASAYRYILGAGNSRVIQLEKELQFLGAYYNLLKVRFGSNIDLVLDIDPSVKKKFIVPLALQMLVENCVKHNVISERHQLKIFIRSQTNKISVSNELMLKNNSANSNGQGLKNINAQYVLLSNQEVIIQQKNGNYKVDIPLLDVHQYTSTIES